MVAYDESGKFCTNCQKHVIVKRKATNHILHFLICVFTCGFWAIGWAWLAVKFGGWHCSICGCKKLT